MVKKKKTSPFILSFSQFPSWSSETSDSKYLLLCSSREIINKTFSFASHSLKMWREFRPKISKAKLSKTNVYTIITFDTQLKRTLMILRVLFTYAPTTEKSCYFLLALMFTTLLSSPFNALCFGLIMAAVNLRITIHGSKIAQQLNS